LVRFLWASKENEQIVFSLERWNFAGTIRSEGLRIKQNAMKLPPPNLNSLWASLIVEELLRNGVDYFCLAPGSRCTPLTVAIADKARAKKSIHFDERGVAFHALGYSRATGRPAVVVTTSGTAVPNTMPAVVEAAMEHIPLLLLTADRPPELRACAANQTIDQIKIFGDFVRWFVDLPCPDEQVPPEVVLTTIDQAVYRSRIAPGGPVHVNCMFREPLAPEIQDESLHGYLSSAETWLEKEGPYTEYALPVRTVDAHTLKAVAGLLDNTEQGLVIVGGLHASEQDAVSHLLGRLQWPVCADVTSGLRMNDGSGLVMGCCDVLARSRPFARAHHPETVLHLGGRFVSKNAADFISSAKPSHYILIANHPHRQDPGHQVTLRLEGDLPKVCSDLSDRLEGHDASPWLDSWQNAKGASQKVFDRFAKDGDDLNEPIVAFLISQNIPSDHGLFLASSMPVRDMDLFADMKGSPVPVGANRGVSGVDGTIACATGFARGLKRPVTVLMGDLAFLHDLNSLNYLRNNDHPIVAIVINNNGGGIFSFLPIARFSQYFEKYFVTPHDLTFEPVATMFGLSYYHPENRQEFLSHYQSALKQKRSAIVEVRIDRKKNHARHSQLVKDMLEALDS
jgi:2-succinyl-5-enolpyruvyl-6-hydroxy-3-cyclohexene-1-carboxylate synthase